MKTLFTVALAAALSLACTSVSAFQMTDETRRQEINQLHQDHAKPFDLEATLSAMAFAATIQKVCDIPTDPRIFGEWVIEVEYHLNVSMDVVVDLVASRAVKHMLHIKNSRLQGSFCQQAWEMHDELQTGN